MCFQVMRLATSLQDAKDQVAGSSLCWACGEPLALSAHFCASCGKVQPARPLDHFAFFSLPRKLNLDIAALEKEFYRLSRKLHPDLYARATAQEQEWSLQKSSQLNDAYRALKDPIARTQALLALEGVQLEEQSAAATKQARATGQEKKQVVPPELLEEVFELNMQLQELKADPTDDAVATELTTKKADLEARLEQMNAELKTYWDAWDNCDAAARAQAKDQMVALLNRRSYIRNLVRDVNAALAAKEPGT